MKSRAYSEKPSAVRMRRMREKRKRAELHQLGLLELKDAPKVITWHCGCGAAVQVFDHGAVQLDAWVAHRRACLFAREAYPVVLEKRAPADDLQASPAEADAPAPALAAGGKP